MHGTDDATRERDPYDSDYTTYNLRSGGSHAREEQDEPPASSSPDLFTWIREQIRATGKYLTPSDFVIGAIVDQLHAALEDDEQRRAYVTDRLADLVSRGVSQTVLERALRVDCHQWTPPEERERNTTAPARKSGPSQRYESAGYEKKLDHAIKHGTRNLKAETIPLDELRRQDRQRELEQHFRVGIEVGLIPKGTSFSEELLRDLGLLPEQLEAGVSPAKEVL